MAGETKSLDKGQWEQRGLALSSEGWEGVETGPIPGRGQGKAQQEEGKGEGEGIRNPLVILEARKPGSGVENPVRSRKCEEGPAPCPQS